MKETTGVGVCVDVSQMSVCVCGGGVTLTMAAIVYQSPSSINQDDLGLIGVLVKLVTRPPFPPMA